MLFWLFIFAMDTEFLPVTILIHIPKRVINISSNAPRELYKGMSINQYSCIKFLVNKIVRKYHIFSSICFLWPEGIAVQKYY